MVLLGKLLRLGLAAGLFCTARALLLLVDSQWRSGWDWNEKSHFSVFFN